MEKNSTKSGVSPARHGSEIRKDYSNSIHGVLEPSTQDGCNQFCVDERLVCYVVQHDSRNEFDAWKKTFFEEQCKIVVKEAPELDVASLGFPAAQHRWSQRIFIHEDDISKLGTNVSDVDFAEVEHTVGDVTFDVQIFRDHLLGDEGDDVGCITGLEDVYPSGGYKKREALATAALRAFMSKTIWNQGYAARQEGDGTCPPVTIRRTRLPGKGPFNYSYAVKVEVSKEGRATKRWLRNTCDWSSCDWARKRRVCWLTGTDPSYWCTLTQDIMTDETSRRRDTGGSSRAWNAWREPPLRGSTALRGAV